MGMAVPAYFTGVTNQGGLVTYNWSGTGSNNTVGSMQQRAEAMSDALQNILELVTQELDEEDDVRIEIEQAIAPVMQYMETR